ncbi:adenosine deaminase [Chitinophaga nivalis]|uniref:adenosine deaminase n=1 Tax=Chitinophaga nivalis TaxID=2991709 RepID=A0ABT3II53_9BACT|nr:adenosine deaminase [Chitinophaga nivalis]MCW3466659.1 adenosine deaminase [Chitinophaga nivalis]MCW3483650.1 adenosine deaminase [Chitinophaga nivalis]
MDYKTQPKVELHLHLDCSLSYEVVKRIDPSVTWEAYQDSFIAPARCTDLADYITRAVKGFELMQTKEQLQLVTADLFRQLKADHVVYAEIRFAPLQHTRQGLTPAEVVAAVNEATAAGICDYGVEARIILCTLRHYSAAQSMETVQLVEAFKGTYVVGFDIAADEAGFPVDNHVAAFAYAAQHHIPCTAHAGEACGAGSIRETLDKFRPRRIGHGVRCIEDPALLLWLKTHGIHLEVCPTSNIQTAVFDNMAQHAADRIFKAGISMSINTDARTISDTTLTAEYRLLEQTFQWNRHHFKQCNLAAIDHAFAPDTVKAAIRRQIEAAY